MKLSELSVLLPCHSLEDFPVYHEADEADELLAAWCCLWHPALLAAANALPVLHRVDVPPESLEGRLLTVPPFCVDRLPAGFVSRVESEAAGLVRPQNRDEGVQAALAAIGVEGSSVDVELAADFLALGFCRLQMELLTRQMRYSVNIDETHFAQEAVAGAQAAMRHEVDLAREHLTRCLEALYEARNRFYPVDVYLLDLTMLAESVLGAPLAAELASELPTNLYGPIGLVEATKRDHPATWSALLAAIDRGTAYVLGGEVQERALPLLPLETARDSILQGTRRYEELLGRLPQAYARRRAGLWPGMPQILVKLAYQGVLHFTLDDGRFPLPAQSKTRWEGLDASTLDAYGHLPSDAAKPETFLGLSRKMADSMDNDHVATVVFAHWPDTTSPWYQDLRRIARMSPVLGKFTLLDDYFAHTDMPGRLSKFDPDQYRTPYLKQAIRRRHHDAISAFVREHVGQSQRAAAQTIAALTDLTQGHSVPQQTEPNASGSAADACARLAEALPRTGSAGSPRWLVVNPLSFTRRIGVELPEASQALAVTGPVVAAGSAGSRHFAVVETPALGFAWIEPSQKPTVTNAKPIAVGNKLTNEFLEVTVSNATGGIQSLYDFSHRGNQLSQQVAYRLPGPTGEPGMGSQDTDEGHYSSMRAEQVEITASCPAFGEIVSRGTLVAGDGRTLAGFRQTIQLWAGSRVITLEVELDAVEEPRADPWNSYCALRFAWPLETAELWRGVGLVRERTGASRLEAPEYIEIESLSGHVTLLTGGLPYHRRDAGRMLDSLLVVRGERERRFHVGIGVSLPQPAAAALEFLTPQTVQRNDGPPGSTDSGWFFHLDAKNVVATHWEPLVDADAPTTGATGGTSPVIGFRARLLETAGRAGRVTLRTFRPVAKARQVDFLGQTLLQAPVDGDKITLDFGSQEWIEVEATWAG